MTTPKLHLKYAYPLDVGRRRLWSDRNYGYYPSIEEVENKIDEWKKIWSEINKDDKVFKLIIKITGVNIPRDLELYVFGTGLHPMSEPLIMPITENGKKSLRMMNLLQ